MPIEFNRVSFTYSPKSPFQYEALKDINLLLADHDFTALIGHTGSGKSTLVQLINGLLLPSKGVITVDDQLVAPFKPKKYFKKCQQIVARSDKHTPEEVAIAKEVLEKKANHKVFSVKILRKKVGIVFQFPEYQLFEETVEKDVAFGPINFGLKPEEAMKKAHEALLKVGLDATYFQRSPFELSGGERRRVAIAGILAIEPEVLILDEPTAGLDPRGAKAMMDLFVDLYNAGTSIILVTHDMDIVLRYASNVIVMKDGAVIEITDPLSLFAHQHDDYSLEVPPLYAVARRLVDAGYQIDIRNLKSEDDLAKAIALGRKRS